MAKKTRLGKGLGALIGGDTETEKVPDAEPEKKTEEKKSEEPGKELFLKVSMIEPNKEQPRKKFDEDQLKELADSMKQYGVLQPLLVQKKGNFYEIIAGERRWRAAKLAGLKEVPAVIREYDEQQKMEIALIENVQREDLNPIEEAMAYKRLMEEFHLKQEEIADRVSKNRTTITNSMRLLKLAEEVQKMLVEGVLSSGHARALLGLEDKKAQIMMAEKILAEGLSVRDVERLVKSFGKTKKKKEKESDAVTLAFQHMEEKMKAIMGTKVSINRKDKNKGRIEIEYYSPAELERIIELIESIRQ